VLDVTQRRSFWKQFSGGEEVSQCPLKDKAFSTSLGQNPPLELRPENGIAFNKRPSRLTAHRQHINCLELRHNEMDAPQLDYDRLVLLGGRADRWFCLFIFWVRLDRHASLERPARLR
jgi:hypothetical protein